MRNRQQRNTMEFLVLVLLLLTTTVKSQSIPEPPVNTATELFTEGRLNCTATWSPGSDDLEWLHHLDPITYPAGRRIWSTWNGMELTEYEVDESRQDGYDLIMPSMVSDVAGTYECRFIRTPATTGRAELVAVSDMSCGNPVPPEYVEGQAVTLTCEVQCYGYKCPELSWWDDFGMLTSEQIVDGVPENTVRWITNLTAEPMHNYMQHECRLEFITEGGEATAPRYTDECFSQFYVDHAPTNVQIYPAPPEEGQPPIQVYLGESFNCSAWARPEPGYEWMDIDETQHRLGDELIFDADMMPEEGMDREQTWECIVKNEFAGTIREDRAQTRFIILGEAPDPGASTGTEGWVIAVAVLVPLIVIGAVVGGVFFYLWYKKKNANQKPPPSQPYTGSGTGSGKPANQSMYPNSHGDVVRSPGGTTPTGTAPTRTSGANPGYHNTTGSNQSIPAAGRDSPGYGDLGIRHFGTSYNSQPSGTDDDEPMEMVPLAHTPRS